MSPPKTTWFSSAGDRLQNLVKENPLSETAAPPTNKNKYDHKVSLLRMEHAYHKLQTFYNKLLPSGTKYEMDDVTHETV
jgi:hypothetical protein